MTGTDLMDRAIVYCTRGCSAQLNQLQCIQYLNDNHFFGPVPPAFMQASNGMPHSRTIDAVMHCNEQQPSVRRALHVVTMDEATKISCQVVEFVNRP